VAIFERLAQHLKPALAELGQLVEEVEEEGAVPFTCRGVLPMIVCERFGNL